MNTFWIQAILSMPRMLKKIIQAIFDFSALFISYTVSFWFFYEIENGIIEIFLGLIFAAISVATFSYLKVYNVFIRFFSLKLIQLILISQLISVVILGLIFFLSERTFIPASFIQLFFTSILFIVSGRYAARIFLDSYDNDGKKVIIYGAGKKAIELMSLIRRESGYDVFGFIDEGKNATGLELHGLPVFANSDLEDEIVKNKISVVVLADHSQTIFRNHNLLNRLESLPVEVKCAPSLNAYLKDKDSSFNYLEDLRIEDIMGRESVKPDQDLLKKNIKGKIILVTGAGGSIGSELCRQVINLSPQKLILLEQNEFALFNIQEELINFSDTILPVLGSVCDDKLVESLLRKEKVDTVYHAAAYKHVPLVEANPLAGIFNNVFGTKKILDASIREGVSSFTLISSDKAVRPTNIMGASKRISEILCQNASIKESEIIISSVRFGNVIGSSGSVIPKFREQIRKGGPVTVTHPEVTRFFMGIHESSELVIQSSSMAKGGEVFVLDMGEQVKIIDLVKKMIRFSGKVIETEQNKDKNPIKIVYTGLRPGEKLYEELLISGDFKKTSHPKIMLLNEPYPDFHLFEEFLENLKVSIENNDINEMISLLSKNNLGYSKEDNSKIIQANNDVSIKEVLLNDSLKTHEKISSKDSENMDSQFEHKSSLHPIGMQFKSNLLDRYKYLRNILHKYFLLSRALTMGVRCAVFNEKEEVLLVKHTYIGGWHLPGGGIDIGESAEEAVHREIREETSIDLMEKPKLLGIFYSKRLNKRDHVVLFSSDKFSIDESVTGSFEISSSKFFPVNDLPDELDASSRYWLIEAFSERKKP